MKKNYYVSPEAFIINVATGSFMIEIGSGNTSPEESDSNTIFFDDEGGESLPKAGNLWD